MKANHIWLCLMTIQVALTFLLTIENSGLKERYKELERTAKEAHMTIDLQNASLKVCGEILDNAFDKVGGGL